jgi:hypothetical protein
MNQSIKQPWNHTQQCTSCQEREVPPDAVYKNGASGCRHYRGGKSASKRGQSWPHLERGLLSAA